MVVDETICVRECLHVSIYTLTHAATNTHKLIFFFVFLLLIPGYKQEMPSGLLAKIFNGSAQLRFPYNGNTQNTQALTHMC